MTGDKIPALIDASIICCHSDKNCSQTSYGHDTQSQRRGRRDRPGDELRERENAKRSQRRQRDLRQEKEPLQHKQCRRRCAQVQVTDPDKKWARENKCDQTEPKIPACPLKGLDRSQYNEQSRDRSERNAKIGDSQPGRSAAVTGGRDETTG